MSKQTKLLVVLCVGVSLVFGTQIAFAKQGGNTPPGWGKGEKKGWGGKSTPPGMAKKEGATAKKNMNMKMKGMKKGGVFGKGPGTQAQ